MSWLAMPQLWVGVGLFILAAFLLLGSNGEKKKARARLERVTRKTVSKTAINAESLRRRDPNEGSALGQKLAGINSIEKLRGRLDMAGLAMTPQKLLTYCGILFVVVVLFTIILGKPILLGLGIGVLVALGLPNFLINRKLRKRKAMFLKLFPEAIELIVRGLRAGLPVGESFQTVAKEIPAPLGNVFATISQQTGLGVPMEKALADAAERIDLTEFNFFVTTIILQRETGGNLGEILSNLSEMLRGRQMMKLKIGALSSEARASAYIVGALPFVVFGILTVVSPRYLDPLYDDFRGNMAVLAALGLITGGGFIMKRMAALEI